MSMYIRKTVVLLSVIMAPLFNVGGQSIVAESSARGQATVATRRITLSLNGVSVEQAIRAMAQQAQLDVTYVKRVIPARNIESLQLANATVESAFAQVLRGTGLIAHVFANGQVDIVPVMAGGSRENGMIVGRISDSKTDKGISGATISVKGDARSVITGEDGTYKLSGVSAGIHTISVRIVGYARQTRSVAVGEGATATANFKLEPSANVLDQVIVTGTVVATELRSVPSAITVITAKQIEEKGITRVDQLFRGDVPGLFAQNRGSDAPFDEVVMFSRGAIGLGNGLSTITTMMKTYVDGVEMADAKYVSQIDPRSIERIEILAGPQASTIYGSNAINGVMQIFTKRGLVQRPQLSVSAVSGITQNNYSSKLAPSHSTDTRLTGMEGRLSYNVGSSIDYTGSWTPGKRTTRFSGYGGARFSAGQLTVDLSARNGLTNNKKRGHEFAYQISLGQSGFWNPSSNNYTTGLTTAALNGRTVGLAIDYNPASWWSHSVGIGSDGSNSETMERDVIPSGISDTLLSLSQSASSRVSQRYTTTANIPLASIARVTITFGADHWRSRSSSGSSTGLSLTGTLSNPSITRNKPQKNTGTFLQSQLSVMDDLFFTYGLRAEWNPNYGDDAQPNLAPRYGVAYTKEIGFATAKLRASYGRSTKPPVESQKLAVAGTSATQIALYGPYNTRLANPELGPEYQQGGEGGLELYFNNRGSIVVTRYNQTVEALVAQISGVDSARSLLPDPDPAHNFGRWSDGYLYTTQSQYLNVGSIRNQGWELQGSLNLGPFTTRGTYSWTKSRVIGITPRYRTLLTGTQYEPGAPFRYVPEHTAALSTTYAHGATTAFLGINSIGPKYRAADELLIATGASGISLVRLTTEMVRFGGPSNWRWSGKGYMTADFNAAHRVSSSLETTLQVQNLTNYYTNDTGIDYAVAGRQTKIGLRWKTK